MAHGMPAAPWRGALASVEKLRPMLQGNAKDAYKHAYFSDMFDAQVDIMARALVTGHDPGGDLAGGQRRQQRHRAGRPGLSPPHHLARQPDHLLQLQNWYFTKLARGERRQIVERLLGQGIEHLVGPQGLQSARLVEGLRWRLHRTDREVLATGEGAIVAD